MSLIVRKCAVNQLVGTTIDQPTVQKAERVNRARAMETNSAFFFTLRSHIRSKSKLNV